MGKYQIVINRFNALSKKDSATYASEMMAHPFSEDEGWGFSDVLRVGDSIKAVLQKRISTYYNIWNDEIQQVERQCFQIVTEVPFEMDFHDGLLLAEGSNTQLNRVKQAFEFLFGCSFFSFSGFWVAAGGRFGTTGFGCSTLVFCCLSTLELFC